MTRDASPNPSPESIRALAKRLGVQRLAKELGVSRIAVGSLLAGTAQAGTYALIRESYPRLLAELAAHDRGARG